MTDKFIPSNDNDPKVGRLRHYQPRKLKLRSHYTTGDVCKAIGCAARTVSKWFDSGKLGGFRLPGSADRRVPHKDLIRFMIDRGIPIPPELGGTMLLLCGFLAPEWSKEFHKFDIEVDASLDSIKCIGMAEAHQPTIAAINVGALGRTTAFSMMKHFAGKGTTCIALANIEDTSLDALVKDGYDMAFPSTVSGTEVLEWVVEFLKNKGKQ